MLGSVLNALSFSPNLSRASLHSFTIVQTMSLSLNSSSSSMMSSLPFPNTLRNMKREIISSLVFCFIKPNMPHFLSLILQDKLSISWSPSQPTCCFSDMNSFFLGNKSVRAVACLSLPVHAYLQYFFVPCPQSYSSDLGSVYFTP